MPLLALGLENIGELVAFGRRIVSDQRLGRIDVAAKRVSEVRVDIGRAFGGVAALRAFFESLRLTLSRFAGAMGVGEIGAPVPGIVRRRLKPSMFPSPLWGGVRGGGGKVTR